MVNCIYGRVDTTPFWHQIALSKTKQKKTKVVFLTPFPINVKLCLGNLPFYRLIQDSGSLNIKAKFKDKFLTTMLKWWKVLLGRKPSEVLYLSDDRISQVNFPALSGKAATLKEKHARLSRQENAHDKLSSTTRLTRAVIFKKENLSSLKLTNSNLCGIELRLMAAAVLSTEVSKSKDKINWLSSQKYCVKGRSKLVLIIFFANDLETSFTYVCQHVHVKAKSREEVF